MKRVPLLTVAALALGAASLSAQASKAPAARQPAARQAAAGTVIRVRMLQQGTVYKFDPANFTVHPGDVVDFVNVSGFPHNVMFEAGKIPAGAADALNRNMTQRQGSLQGPMMGQANQTYRVNFAGAPVGRYEYFCLPHKALGMKGVITVAAGAAPARH